MDEGRLATRRLAAAERSRKLERLAVPEELDFQGIPGLRNEASEKLARFRPATLGMASRISGVTPADVAVLLVAIERRRRERISSSPTQPDGFGR